MKNSAAMHALPPLPTLGLCSGPQTNTSSQFQLSLLSLSHPTRTSNPTWKMAARRRSALFVICRDVSEPGNVATEKKKKKKKKRRKKSTEINTKEDEDEVRGAEVQLSQQQTSPSVSVLKRLDDVNPVGLGRRSRQIFDDVWRKFSGLGQISRTTLPNDENSLLIGEGGPMCEFAIPGAQNTTVLVVGATSRVGRIVGRKLMLRGYAVKALVRKASKDVRDMLPTSVEIVTGDVGDFLSLKPAVEGCNKVIYCATARSSITGDLNRVDHQGVCNVAKAFQGYNNELAQLRAGKSSKSKLLIAKFKSADSLHGWEVRQGTYFQDVIAAKYDAGMDAKFEYTENGEAIFSGTIGGDQVNKRMMT